MNLGEGPPLCRDVKEPQRNPPFLRPASSAERRWLQGSVLVGLAFTGLPEPVPASHLWGFSNKRDLHTPVEERRAAARPGKQTSRGLPEAERSDPWARPWWAEPHGKAHRLTQWPLASMKFLPVLSQKLPCSPCLPLRFFLCPPTSPLPPRFHLLKPLTCFQNNPELRQEGL